MKKLLVGTAAIALGLAMSAPAKAADGVKLGVGGYFKGYASWLDQDEPTGVSVDSFDILRDTEIHFTGETTLDNGLTVGFHTELEDDQEVDGFGVNESYAYFSGAWGRVNFGTEDGAAYLLQVAAPSADSNVDGLRQYVSGTNFANLVTAGAGGDGDQTLDDLFSGSIGANETLLNPAGGFDSGDEVDSGTAFAGSALVGGTNTLLDYQDALSASDDKITYLSPVFSGFQVGGSYTPNLDVNSDDAFAKNGGHPVDDTAYTYDGVWEAAARWEGSFNNVGIAFGGAYSHSNLQNDGVLVAGDGNNVMAYLDADNSDTFNVGDTSLATIDDRDVWNVGLDLNYGAFGLGGAFVRDNMGASDNFDRDVWTVGADYTTGPYKLGLSYYNQTQDYVSGSVDTDRWTGGVVYTYGPGMTFRGSVSYLDMEEDIGDRVAAGADTDANSTNVLLGTQIDF